MPLEVADQVPAKRFPSWVITPDPSADSVIVSPYSGSFHEPANFDALPDVEEPPEPVDEPADDDEYEPLDDEEELVPALLLPEPYISSIIELKILSVEVSEELEVELELETFGVELVAELEQLTATAMMITTMATIAPIIKIFGFTFDALPDLCDVETCAV